MADLVVESKGRKDRHRRNQEAKEIVENVLDRTPGVGS